jgi:hypothetical protein
MTHLRQPPPYYQAVAHATGSRYAAWMRLILFACLPAIFPLPPMNANVVTIQAHGESLRLEPAPASNGNSLIFTTYDGEPGDPLTVIDGDTTTGSNEVRSESEGSTNYLTDYLFVDTAGAIAEYGTLALTITGSDNDGNDVFDFHQLAFDGNLEFSGATDPDFNAGGFVFSVAIDGSVARTAGNLAGTYGGTASLSFYSTTFSGIKEIVRMIGTGAYTPADSGQIGLALSHNLIGGGAPILEGSALFTIIDAENLQVGPSTLDDGANASVNMEGFTLTRTNDTYRASITLDDGNPETPWADFLSYRLEIVDANDWDGDGIPDLTDPNHQPIMEDASFTIAENAIPGFPIGILAATDPDPGSGLLYSIISEEPSNGGGASAESTSTNFEIDPESGWISVTEGADLNNQVNPTWFLTVQVADSGGLEGTATVTINIADQNEVPSVLAATFSIAENSPSETPVGTVEANHPTSVEALVFSIAVGDPDALFSIGPANGEIIASGDLDHETGPTFVLIVKATDATGLSGAAVVRIIVTDVNETPHMDDAEFSIAENAPGGEILGSITAVDPDDNDELSYAITAEAPASGSSTSGDIGAGNFTIDASNGRISVAPGADLDYESAPAWILTVRATDSGSLNTTAAVAIDLVDQNEPPVMAEAAFTIGENAPGGATVGTISALDYDDGEVIYYTITAQAPAEGGGSVEGALEPKFKIGKRSGQISVLEGAILDFETIPAWILNVRATDLGGLHTTAAVAVDLANRNEPPTVESTAFTVDENAAPHTSIGNVTAGDPDMSDVLAFSIGSGSGDPDGLFAIDEESGEITVIGVLDHEAGAELVLTVKATDTSGLEGTAFATITVTDLNEPPVMTDASFSIGENAPGGATLGTITALDPDDGEVLSYAITAQSPAEGNSSVEGALEPKFEIDEASGRISVLEGAILDFEAIPAWILTVRATDSGGLNTTATVFADLANRNEPPTVEITAFTVDENAAPHTSVGNVAAGDPDMSDVLAFSIDSGDPDGLFAIDEESGEITVIGSLDHEAGAERLLAIKATDPSGLEGTASATITVTDLNEPPVMADASFSIGENAPSGATLGTITALDTDNGEVLSYAITAQSPAEGNGRVEGALEPKFEIEEANGRISVLEGAILDFEAIPAWILTVRAIDSGGLNDEATVTIDLIDRNDPPTVENTAFVLPENAVAGTLVGTVTGIDPDASDSLSYAIDSGDPDNLFSISPENGDIVVISNLDHETGPSHLLTVISTDRYGLSATAYAAITVEDVNEPPVLNDAAFSIGEDAPGRALIGAVTAVDPDNGEVHRYTITREAAVGSSIAGESGPDQFDIGEASGTISVAEGSGLNFESTPAWILSVQALDSGGMVATATVTVNLTDENYPPIVLSSGKSGDEDTEISFDPADFINAFNDEDANASLTAIRLLSVPANGILTLQTVPMEIGTADFGNLVFSPIEHWHGESGFLWTGSDGTIHSSSAATMVITVNPVNDPPQINLPGPIETTTETDTSLTGIQVSDIDSGNESVTLTLSVDHGKLRLGPQATAITEEGIPGGESGAPILVLKNTIAGLNEILSGNPGLIHAGNLNFVGVETLSASLSDNGHTGAGEQQTATAEWVITVTGGTTHDWRNDHFDLEDLRDPGKESTVWGLSANPDGDPFPNLIESFMDLDPNTPDTAETPALDAVGGVLFLTYRRAKTADPSDGIIEWSADLKTWSHQGVTENIIGDLGTAVLIQASIPEVPTSAVIYLRLKVNP